MHPSLGLQTPTGLSSVDEGRTDVNEECKALLLTMDNAYLLSSFGDGRGALGFTSGYEVARVTGHDKAMQEGRESAAVAFGMTGRQLYSPTTLAPYTVQPHSWPVHGPFMPRTIWDALMGLKFAFYSIGCDGRGVAPSCSSFNPGSYQLGCAY